MTIVTIQGAKQSLAELGELQGSTVRLAESCEDEFNQAELVDKRAQMDKTKQAATLCLENVSNLIRENIENVNSLLINQENSIKELLSGQP